MADYEDVYAPDLTEETESTLSGSEQFVMFDSVEGKRAELSTIADYIVENGEIDGSDIPTIVSTIEGNIGTVDTKVGDLTDLETTDKTSIVSAVNEVNGKAEDADEKADTVDGHVGDLSELDTEDKTSAVGAINEVYGDLSDKADQNGVYPDLSVGNITGDFHIDTKPYLYRALRDVASHIGSKAFDTLVGGSVAVNQLVNTGTTSVTIPSGHKYYSNINNIKTIGASTGAAIAINDDTKDNVIDLTQLFASDPSIADRAYTLESGTAGSGIAWLKSYGFLTKDYYPYNAGTLQSVKTTAHVTRNADDTIINNYPLDDIELRGVAKLVNNEIKYDGDTYESDGTVTRKYGIVDLGTLNWSKYGSTEEYDRYITGGIDSTSRNGVRYAVCNKFPIVAIGGTYVANAVTFGTGSMRTSVTTSPLAYSDVATFKAAMSGVYLVYELATPTEEQAEPFTNPQTVDPNGTEQYVDTRTVPIPVGHETKYELDLASKLIGLPWDLSMLAPIENGTTASQAYAAGKYFVRNNEFCKAKTSIASGATFTLGTNYEVTTVGAELFALA